MTIMHSQQSRAYPLAQAERQRQTTKARSGDTGYIFASVGLASCRRRRLSSNVDRRKLLLQYWCLCIVKND